MVELILVALILGSIVFIAERVRHGGVAWPSAIAIVVVACTIAVGYYQFGIGR